MTIIDKKQTLVRYRAVFVVLSIVLLWGFGISLLINILNISIGFADNDADFKSAFLQMNQNRETNQLFDYLDYALRAKQHPDEPGVTDNLRTYEAHFSPENTNFRFAATDADGNLLLTNDPLYGMENEQEIMASEMLMHQITTNTRSYQIQRHFDDPIDAFPQIVYGNVSKYLDNPREYSLWYFADPAIDAAYHDSVEIIQYLDKQTEILAFSSKDAAEKYDYEARYGETYSCSYDTTDLPADDGVPVINDPEPVMAPQTAVTEPAPNQEVPETPIATTYSHFNSKPFYVTVTWYETIDHSNIPLEVYYDLKQSDDVNIKAFDTELEKALMAGLDIVIRATHDEVTNCYIRCYLPETLSVDDTIRSNYGLFYFVYQYSDWAMGLLFTLMVLVTICCIAMCTAAGHTLDSDDITVSKVHQMAYEIFWLMPPAVVAFSGVMTYLMLRIQTPYRMIAIFWAGMVLCIAALCVLWLYTTAVRAKAGTYWSSFLFVRLFRSFFGLFRSRTSVCIGIILYCPILFLINCCAIDSANYHGFTLWVAIGLILDIGTLLLILYCVYSYYELYKHVRQIRSGDFTPAEHPVKLLLDFSQFDRSLNEITASVGEIVARQTKAEHLRTELITNVSHDLKTPLTSIVNYVDLLSREPMQTDNAEEYLSVLKRQAARLKKLTVDLVDASKASTVNLTVELVPTDIHVLIGQLTGEYEENLAQKQLSLVLNVPDEAVSILADGRQIWRVFDNLLNNACKYALAGTRVYLDVFVNDVIVEITLKNISATPLNISPDELMERFVRGDSSRSTEGSGLGLSIARDLTALQNGLLTLSTDGDLFKAHLSFPRYFPPEERVDLEIIEAEIVEEPTE